MAFRIMKNAGYSDEDSKLKHEMMTIEELIRKAENPNEKEELSRKLNEKMLRFNSVMAKRGQKTNSAIFKNYGEKINKKLF